MKLISLAALLIVAGCSTTTQEQIGPERSVDASTEASVDSGAAPGDITQGGSRLRPRVYAGDDGSQQFIGWFDFERSENCGFQTAADGAIRCLPTSTMSANYFSNSGCTQPLGVVSTGCAPTTYALVATSGVSCTTPTTGPRVFSVSGKTTPVSVWTGTPASCVGPTAPNASLDYYSLGAEVPATSFQSATEQTL